MSGSGSSYLKAVEGRKEIHIWGVLQVVQHKMVEGEQQIGGWKRPVAGLKPAIIVTVVGIGEAEEKFIFSTKMVVKGAAGITGEFDDLRDRSFVIALFCEQLPCCIHDVLFCMSFAVRCHN